MSTNAPLSFSTVSVDGNGRAHLGNFNVTGGVHIHHHHLWRDESKQSVGAADHTFPDESVIQQYLVSQGIHDGGALNTETQISRSLMENVCTQLLYPDRRSPLESLRIADVLRRRRLRNGQYVALPAGARMALQRFNDAPGSSLIMMNGSSRQRLMLQDAASDIVQVVAMSGVPLVYLVEPTGIALSKQFASSDILKCLIAQTIRLNTRFHEEGAFTKIAARMREAHCTEDWVDILAFATDGLPLVYIVILLIGQQHDEPKQAWYGICRALLTKVLSGLSTIRAKVVVVSDGQPATTAFNPGDQVQGYTVGVVSCAGKEGSMSRKRKNFRKSPRAMKLIKMQG